MMKNIPVEDKNKILEYFKTYGVNHIVFLMDWKYHVDDVNGVIREKIQTLQEEIRYNKWVDEQTN